MTTRKTISYLDFVRGAQLTLTPAQEAFAAVAFDGAKPPDTPESRVLWGDMQGPIPPVARRVVAAVCGRGSGKSLLGGTRVAHLACTVDVSKLQMREIAVCPVVSTDLDTAQQVVRFAMGACETVGVRIVGRERDGSVGFTILRDGGRRVRIVARSASVGGRSIRGRSMPVAVLDEAAFFRDASHQINDQDIFDALRPRIMAGGQIILLSSPWIESGLLYDLWRRNYGHPVDALVAHAPTGIMRTDDPDTLASIEAERKVDPEKCARERDAKFMTANAQAFFDPRAIGRAAARDLLPDSAKEHAVVAVGGDFAFRRNSTAFAAVSVTFSPQHNKAIYTLDDLEEHRPHGEPLKPSTICREAATFAKRAGTDQMIADGYSREAVAEHLYDNGVTHIIAPAGTSGKDEVYQVARTLLHEDCVIIPKEIRDDPDIVEKLLRQLREVVGRPLQGGGMSYDSPTWRSGEHGDLVSALLLALWRAYKLGPATAEQFDNPHGLDDIERDIARQDIKHEEQLTRTRRIVDGADSVLSVRGLSGNLKRFLP